ncbi:hypothetical protein H4Q26_001238 [Puccinia striiformis f. sp. tritici PST-130]|nr:hypothetical protein H4Q26_001238 [Puccinia striiformis f. sp. tritici PST-130]
MRLNLKVSRLPLPGCARLAVPGLLLRKGTPVAYGASQGRSRSGLLRVEHRHTGLRPGATLRPPAARFAFRPWRPGDYIVCWARQLFSICPDVNMYMALAPTLKTQVAGQGGRSRQALKHCFTHQNCELEPSSLPADSGLQWAHQQSRSTRGRNESSGSKESTKLKSGNPMTPEVLRSGVTSIKPGWDDNEQAELDKIRGFEIPTRRHISDNKAFESFLIQKRDKAIPSKNLLKAFLDDTKPGTNATSGQGPPKSKASASDQKS